MVERARESERERECARERERKKKRERKKRAHARGTESPYLFVLKCIFHIYTLVKKIGMSLSLVK